MSKHTPGTVLSYLLGFELSIVCTVIPYILVVKHSLTGSTLLATIVGFAMVQMIIQIFFFLHLGRGPKPLYNVAFFVSTVGIIVLVVGGSLFIMSHLHHYINPDDTSKQLAESEAIYQVEGQKTGACQGVKANHVVTVSGGVISPVHTNAKLCDTLTFINEDSASRKINFGTYVQPVTYAGETGLDLRKGRGETITLNQEGAYQFYDRLNSGMSGSFTVAK